jgi:integrase
MNAVAEATGIGSACWSYSSRGELRSPTSVFVPLLSRGSHNGVMAPHALDIAFALARFKRALAAADLPDQRLHDLRHYAATFLVAKGVPMRVVMDILGHAKMATIRISMLMSCPPPIRI